MANLYQFFQAEGGQEWKALNYRFRVRLAIVNNYTNAIELWWINYEGKPDQLVTVQPNRVYFMYTYRTHPILARDKVNGYWLTMNGLFPFFPNPVWQESVVVCDPYFDGKDSHVICVVLCQNQTSILCDCNIFIN